MKKIIILIVFFITTLVITSHEAHATVTVISGPDVVYKQASSIVTINDILLLYNADGHLFSVVEDEYTGNGAKIGTYAVTIKATNGISELTKEIDVTVVSELGNVLLIGDKNFYLRTDQTITFSDIRQTLRNINAISIPAGTGYQIIKDQYTGNEDTPGVYDYQFKLVSPSGYIQNISIKIYVADDFTQFQPGEIIHDDQSINFKVDGLFINVIPTLVLFAVLGFVGFKLYKVFKKKKRFGGVK